MAGSKRERELARAKYERQQARRAAGAERRRRNQRITAIVVVAVLILGAVAYVVVSTRGSDEPSAAAPDATADQAGSEPSTDEPIEEPSVLNCGAPLPTRANTISFDAPGDVDPASSITLTTTCGDIVIALDPAAEKTVRSTTFLAEQGFYDATACHRLTTDGIFVLQCGDPAGDGTGGPGYTVPDENLPADGPANYPAGTVAMANAGPGTSGSQFFLVYEDTTLPPAYTVFGTITQGLDIVQEIASVGTEDGAVDGRPRQPMIIETATVQRS
jgi:peptidyl-prolyl cis-trans isomerase B (cyclophilin B)